MDENNYISALIDENLFNTALKEGGYVAKYFRSTIIRGEILDLKLGAGNLRCIHGRHRILARQQYLEPEDQWWVVKLYRQGKMGKLRPGHGCSHDVEPNATGDLIQTHIEEEFENSKPPSDGEIFRKILILPDESSRNPQAQMVGEVESIETTRTRQILGHADMMKRFDLLLGFPGL